MSKSSGSAQKTILNEENHRYAMNGNRKIEGNVSQAAAALRLEINNLRPNDPRRYTYKFMLLGLRDGQSVYKLLGDFDVGKSGKMTHEYKVDPLNVDGKGNPLDSFRLCMVVAAPHGSRREPYRPVLKGTFAADKSENDHGSTADAETQKVEGSSIGDASKSTCNEYYQTYVREMTAELIGYKDGFRKIIPFEEGWIADNWRYVGSGKRETGLMPEKVFPIASIGAKVQLEKYGHFIFAFNDEYCILGVPGTREEDEHPDGGASGFKLWQPMKGSTIYGYWMVFVQRNSGRITEIS